MLAAKPRSEIREVEVAARTSDQTPSRAGPREESRKRNSRNSAIPETRICATLAPAFRRTTRRVFPLVDMHQIGMDKQRVDLIQLAGVREQRVVQVVEDEAVPPA